MPGVTSRQDAGCYATKEGDVNCGIAGHTALHLGISGFFALTPGLRWYMDYVYLQPQYAT